MSMERRRQRLYRLYRRCLLPAGWTMMRTPRRSRRRSPLLLLPRRLARESRGACGRHRQAPLFSAWMTTPILLLLLLLFLLLRCRRRQRQQRQLRMPMTRGDDAVSQTTSDGDDWTRRSHPHPPPPPPPNTDRWLWCSSETRMLSTWCAAAPAARRAAARRA
jgi:hypothetical protein